MIIVIRTADALFTSVSVAFVVVLMLSSQNLGILTARPKGERSILRYLRTPVSKVPFSDLGQR